MTALPTDFSVTSNRVAPTPTPAWPIDSPFAVTAVSGASITDPDALTAVSVGSISAPVAYSAASESAITLPSVSTAVSIASISAPLLFSGVTAASISAPSVYSSVSDAAISSPVAWSAEAIAGISAPSVFTAVSDAAISAPTTITATTGTATTPPFPLNHARILYDNLLLNYDGVSINSGTNGAYALVPNTYKGWEFTHDGSSTFSWIVELPANVDMDTFCIGAHNISSISGTVEIFYDTDAAIGGFISVGTATPSDSRPIMMHLSSTVSVRRVQVSITSSVAGYVKIGYISAGVALQLQRPFFSGHTPITMADNTVYRNNMTDGGEFTSRSIIRKGFSNSVTLDNVDRTWIQNYFLDFKEVSKEYMYFIAWNLLEYPNEVGLCMTGGDISLQFSGTRDLMSINWSQTGHGSV